MPAFATPCWSVPCRAARWTAARCSRRVVRRRAANITAKWSFDYVPDWVKELDRLEVERRKNEEPMPELPPDVLERLHQNFPELKKIDEFFEKIEAEADDYAWNPDKSDKPFTWMYLLFRPWSPNTPFLIVCAAAAGWALVTAIRVIHNRFSPFGIAAVFLTLDTAAVLLLGLVVPLLFAFLTRRAVDEQTNENEAVTRSAVMAGTTTLTYLVPAWLCASIGYSHSALWVQIFARLVALPLAMWGWSDINEDVKDGENPTVRLFLRWRRWMTALVCGVGVFARALALKWPTLFPVAAEMTAVLEPVRLFLGDRFPVAFSLARDPGGIYFLAFLILLAAFVNALYVIIVSTDFLAVREHRRAQRSLLTSLCERYGVYGTAEDWALRKRGPSTAPPGVRAYRPSPAMLMLPKDLGLFSSDSGSLVQDERTMPILQFLEDEEQLAKEKGVKNWIKPGEQVLSWDSLDKDPLLTWARPLTPEQEAMPMSEFFDLLGEKDYEYDADKDEWVYSAKTKGLDDITGIPDADDDPKQSVFV